MIKLGKLRLENFKTFREPYQVDFTNSGLFIFDGPNGFGKTTVFDAIEVCLTGKIGRVLNTDTKLKQTHLYKSDMTKPTTIFLELKEANVTKAVVFAYLAANTSGDENKTSNVKMEITLLKKWPENFDSDFKQLEQSELTLKNITGNDKLQETFDLFNYVQQEETCHFLKTSEDKRHNKISYLFGTVRQSKAQSKLNIIKNKLLKKRQAAENKIKELRVTEQSFIREIGPEFQDSNSQGKMLPSGSLESLNNLDRNSKEQINRYKLGLESLVWIVENPDGYQKLKFNHLINLLLEAKQQEINDIIIVGHLNDFVQIQKREKHLRWLTNLSKQIDKHKRLSLPLSEYDGELAPEVIIQFRDEYPHIASSYSSKIERYLSYFKEIGSYQDILKKISTSRATLKMNFEAHTQKHPEGDDTCPFCGDLKTSPSELWLEYDKQRDFFDNLKSDRLAQLEGLEQELRTLFITTCLQKSRRFIDRYEHFLRLIPVMQEQIISKDRWARMNKVKLWLKRNEIQLAQLLKPYEFDLTGNKLPELVEEFRMTLRNSILDADNEQNYIELKKALDIYDVRVIDFNLVDNQDIVISKTALVHDLNYMKISELALDSSALQNIKEEIRQLELVGKSLNSKEKLVKGAFKKYKDQIKDYEKSVAKQIAIPFYVYSSKILQTRPDGGIGAFIKTAAASNDGRQNNYIKFVSKLDDDHDAWNTMSSGQLSGLVLSFMLAMNKVYPTKLKSLLIDDPVQTMDEINISSFVQLLKNEFADNQLIISTHERKSANFFAYKYQNQTDVNVMNMKKERLNALGE